MLWGAIDDVGFLARNSQVKEALQQRMGGRALLAKDALAALETALVQGYNNEGVLELDWAALSRFLPTATLPRFADLTQQTGQQPSDKDQSLNIEQMLNELDDETLHEAFIEIIKAELGQILRLSPEKIDSSKSVYDLGLDSLMGVELVVALEARFGVRLTVMAVSENPTLGKLTVRLIEMLKAKSSTNKSELTPTSSLASTATLAQQVNEIVRQHAPEATDNEVQALVSSLHRQETSALKGAEQ
jgi:acyl carrier protein